MRHLPNLAAGSRTVGLFSQLSLPFPSQPQQDEGWHGTWPADYLHFPLAEWARGRQPGEPVSVLRRPPQPVGEIVDPCLPAGFEDPADRGQPAGRVRPVVQRERAHNPVELLIGERQSTDVADLEPDSLRETSPGRSAGRTLNHRLRDIDAGQRHAGSLSRQPHGESARATPNLQYLPTWVSGGYLAGDAGGETFQDRGDQRVVSPSARQVEGADVGRGLFEIGAQPVTVERGRYQRRGGGEPPFPRHPYPP